jgi:hypothetical protein
MDLSSLWKQTLLLLQIPISLKYKKTSSILIYGKEDKGKIWIVD